MMDLENKTPTPLYQQLAAILRTEINDGIYKKGQKIPTEQELSKHYNVSRVTVRNALEELTNENLLIRKRGKGTFVNTDKLSKSITGISSFSQLCCEVGCEPGAKVIKSVIEPASHQDIIDLKLENNANVIIIERIRYADSIPVSFEISRFPERYGFLLKEDLNNCSMFDILKSKYNVTLENANKTIELVYATHQMATYLELSSGYPLLSIQCVSNDQTGLPAHSSIQYIVGDKFKLIV